MSLSLEQWAALAFTAFMHGFNKTGILGCAIVTTPLLLMFFSAGETLGIVLPLLVLADILTLLLLGRSACWPCVLRALPWAILGIGAGWLLARETVRMGGAGDLLLRRTIAVVLVGVVAASFIQRRRRNNRPASDAGGAAPATPPKTWFAAGMGILGGVTTMLANNGGPAWVAYLMAVGLGPRQFLGTAAWLFFIQNAVKIPFAASLGFINADTLRANLPLAPFVFLGVFTGGLAVKRLSQPFFELLTQLMALGGALYLLA
ncbi:MAG: sulfite exporter TauE/SafE family protein [Planctomycetota bacterium]|jgi:uncharacterized membrane protein YfcA|nr:sulfite exporter TauE/SafE family protein [Planctomycetota bacterium]